ncbi:MAG: NTP transferase domain-containing protein [Proteobacteria bacterium]|nr:NTP transferase domain-containing protein [Pseudomonadota bacterium]
MKFGEMPVGEAVGAILAHGLKLDRISFKKGRVLSADDVAALAKAGRASVIAARLEPGDVPEDEAATAVATALTGENLVRSAAFTGRCNLFAATRGIAVIDAACIDALNLMDEAITVATVAPYSLVEPRQMVATIKIIPFAAPEAAVKACRQIVGNRPVLRVAPLRRKAVGLIQTRLPGTKQSVLDGTVATTRARLLALGSELAADTICEHAQDAIAAAITDFRQRGCDPILVLGASAIVDRRDVIPAAIVANGGAVVHFGMPVDPGNLLLLGRIGETPVIGLPGCARSPKFNGFDWVLHRLLADLPISRADIMRMGSGGLLMEIASRPLPRGEAAPEPEAPPRAPRIAAVVLAAGRSSRMAPANKLLTEIDGTPMVERAVAAALASQARPVIVVTGHDGARVRAALAGKSVTFVDNPDFATGLSTSVKAGITALPGDVDGALFVLGDMPRVTPAHLDRLIAAFSPADGRLICVPTHHAKRGNPVLWAARFFAEMQAIDGDRGARTLLGEHAERVCEVDMADDGVLLDIDTPDALAALRGQARQASG